MVQSTRILDVVLRIKVGLYSLKACCSPMKQEQMSGADLLPKSFFRYAFER